MLELLNRVETVRRKVGRQTERKRKSELGQFMTPAPVARFMASLFLPGNSTACRLLDQGAGIGSLSSAFIERWTAGDLPFCHVELDAYEIDAVVRPHLEETLIGKTWQARRCHHLHLDRRQLRRLGGTCPFLRQHRTSPRSGAAG